MQFSDKTNEMIKKVTANRPHIRFTIGILHEEKTTYKLFGSDGETPYKSHLYETGSVGKVFATSLLAKFLQEGLVDLEESVSKYIPELDNNKYYPTLKRLATHTAGYPTRYPMTKAEVFKFLGKILSAKVTKKPAKAEEFLNMDYNRMIKLAKGSKLENKDYKWAYSNFGISLLGYAMSCVAGKDFWDLMGEFMSDDLGLENSFMGAKHPGILTGYNAKNQNVGNWSLGKEDYLTPAGGITSNAEDLLAFAKMNIEESPAYLSLCHVGYDMNSKHSNMGLGWWIDYKNPSIYYHGGNVDGFASMLAFDKKKKAAVVILANVNHYREREELFMDILGNL